MPDFIKLTTEKASLSTIKAPRTIFSISTAWGCIWMLLLFNGYSTISLGYAGLCECVRYMKGVSHTEPKEGTPFALKVMPVSYTHLDVYKRQGVPSAVFPVSRFS